ncbi:E2/UBC family protein [Pelomonas sp. KK5]|uniref:E2/UBC family protein n=1 Tax=Pelomonas sp. KK5 TaxID=1855730 RepID=UPI00097BEC62|nr:E2/UBC family protein [Pelomonas sp. KK5]
MLEDQFEDLKKRIRERKWGGEVTMTAMPNGGMLIRVPAVPVKGWNRTEADVLFVAPPGYPSAQPDCFWVEPNNFRLENGSTAQASNDGNPIPGDPQPRSTTWFSWHLQKWNPNQDSLIGYFHTILDRLMPAR